MNDAGEMVRSSSMANLMRSPGDPDFPWTGVILVFVGNYVFSTYKTYNKTYYFEVRTPRINSIFTPKKYGTTTVSFINFKIKKKSLRILGRYKRIASYSTNSKDWKTRYIRL